MQISTTALDFETSRFPDGSPYRATAKAISWATQDSFHYYTDPDFTTQLQSVINGSKIIITVNGKFDIGWTRRSGCEIPTGLRIWDCQLAEFILSGQTNSFASMGDLCERYNLGGKEDDVKNYWDAGIETEHIPRALLETYNVGDCRRTLSIYECQLKDPRMSPALQRLIWLGGADLLVLQQMEQNGILYNCSGSIAKGDEASLEIGQIKDELNVLVGFPDFNFDSGDHLSCFLYGGVVSIDRYAPVHGVYKSGPRKGEAYTQNKFQETIEHKFEGLFKPLPKTELKKAGYFSTGEPILKQLKGGGKQGKRVVECLLRLAELSKQVGSFLHALPALCESSGWAPGTAEGTAFLCPTYNQCVARTGRLSCSKPNAQQFPDVVDEFWISRYP